MLFKARGSIPATPQQNGNYGNFLMMDTYQGTLISTAYPSQKLGDLLGNIA